jgi:glycosyltransferase involved in cell wall biosynthesis
MTGLLKMAGLKVVLTYHSINYHHQKWSRFAKAVLKLGEKLGCTYADQIIAISADIKAHVEEKFHREAHLIPNGVEIPKPTESTDYIECIGLKRKNYFLTVGRIVPEKGLDDLISAFSSLQTDWKLAIVGDDYHKTSYSRHLKSKIANNTKIVTPGFIQGDALKEIYSHAGLFVLPSHYEGFPIVTLEALSYGLPVLLSDIAPNKEIGLDENRYFSVGNQEALTKKLYYWIKNSPLSKQEQTRQIEMVEKKYNWDDIAEQVFQVYKEVYDGRNKTQSLKSKGRADL